MTSINKFDRALDVLRQALASRSRTKAETSAPLSQASVPGRANPSNSVAQVKRRIKDRLAPLDLAKREDQERGASIFLETVLGNEFGAELLDDPAFYNLIADVRNTMFADPGTQKDLISVLIDLKGSD